jgi:hypothetical protein
LELDAWLALSTDPGAGVDDGALSSHGRTVLTALSSRGPAFTQELQRASGLLASHFEMGLTELIGHGRITCDSFGGLRRLVTPPSRRRGVMKRAILAPAGRWSSFRGPQPHFRAPDMGGGHPTRLSVLAEVSDGCLGRVRVGGIENPAGVWRQESS